ncbi:MAG: anaerobic ribonucleoside-triphosphate reductase [Candidatus Xenobiia bacterium LiM19]
MLLFSPGFCISEQARGTVQHFYLGERVHDPGAVKRFIRRAFSCFKLPYLSITPTFIVCPHCGYMDGEKEVCIAADLLVKSTRE